MKSVKPVWIVLIGLLISGPAFSAVKPAESSAVPPVSVQLWSVKDALQGDFGGTLHRLADLGFQGVEFAGMFGPFEDDPHGLKLYLNELGLSASGAHVGFDKLAPDVLHKTLLFYKALGVDMLIVPWDERAWDPERIDAIVADLTTLSAVLPKYGMTIGFHNHAQEMADFGDATFWDYIARNTPEHVLLQLDVGWVNFAGRDAVEYVRRYPGRTLTTHYKIRTHEGDGKSPIIGANGYAWDKLIEANIQHGGTRWIVLEQEEYPEGISSMDAVAQSKAGLDAIIHQVEARHAQSN